MNKRPIYYWQTDKRWASKSWKGMTVGVAGCGPTCAAMLIATLTGKPVTPDITYAWAGAAGCLEPGHGTNYTAYFQRQFAVYGLKAEMLNWKNSYGKPQHPNHEKVVQKLREGYYAIALMNKGLWTGSGHFVVLWWQDGKVRINDPASTRPERINGDIKTFRSQVRYYWLVDARAYNNTVDTAADDEKEDEDEVKLYHDVDELPYGRESVQRAIEGGYIKKDQDGKVGIWETNIQTIILMDRAGLFDKPAIAGR